MLLLVSYSRNYTKCAETTTPATTANTAPTTPANTAPTTPATTAITANVKMVERLDYSTYSYNKSKIKWMTSPIMMENVYCVQQLLW